MNTVPIVAKKDSALFNPVTQYTTVRKNNGCARTAGTSLTVFAK